MRVPMRFVKRDEAYSAKVGRDALHAAIKGSVYREVPVAQLVATQRSVNDERVKQYQSPPSPHPPIVVQRGGRYYIHNGHHRATAAIKSGQETLRARVACLDGPVKFGANAPAGTLMMIDPRAMAASYEPREEPQIEIVEGGIAVITIEGALESKRGGAWWAYFDDYESIMQRFHEALDMPEVRAILLKIDSPGGMAAGLNATVDAMRKLKKRSDKLVVAYADEKCCSAAYALACVADAIYLPPAAEIGSIGVTSTMVDATAANKKAGIRVAVLTSGKRKADGNPDVELTREAMDHVQERVDHLAGIYFRLVERARGIPAKQVAALEADTFDGKHAVSAGLADAVWTLERTLQEMRSAIDSGGGLDRPAGGVTNNDPAPEKSKMPKPQTMKEANRAVRRAEKALARAKLAQAAAAKTPPCDEGSSAEDEEEDSPKKEKHEITKEKHEIVPASSSPSEEDEEDEEEGSSGSASSGPPPGSSEEDEEDEEEAASSAEDEEDEEEAAAKLVELAQTTTGKKGKRALGALAAMLAEGQRAAKKVRKIENERRAEKKAHAIQSALSTRRITRHESTMLAKKSSGFVRDFLSMRKEPLVATEEETLRTPLQVLDGGGSDLPPAVLRQIEMAVAGMDDKEAKRLRKKMIEANREQLAKKANGAGAF